MQNVAESEDFSDYVLYLDASTNPDGLAVYLGDQALTGTVVFGGLSYGSYSVTVKIFRGPSKYEYEPISLYFASVCDFYGANTFIPLTVSFVRECAQAEFHKNFRTFAVSSDRFDSLTASFFSIFSPVAVNIYNPAWDFTAWSEYPNLQGIELLYRRVGDSEWRHALDADSVRISFNTVVPEVCPLLLDVVHVPG